MTCYYTMANYKADQSQHETPVQRCLNGAALEMLAITATPPGQSHVIDSSVFASLSKADSVLAHTQQNETLTLFQC